MSSVVVSVALSALTGLAAVRAGTARRRAMVIARLAGASVPRAPRRRSSLRPVEHIAREVATLDLALEPARVWRVWRWATYTAALGGTALVSVVFGVLLAALVAGAPIVAVLVLRNRAEAAYDATLAGALDAAGRSVRSGGSLANAVTEAATSVRGPVSSDLAHVAAAVERGLPFADALAAWRVERDRPSVRLCVGALVLAAQTGGPPARVIEDVAAAIRTRQQVGREAHALAAQARLSAIVVGVAPLGFMLVTCATDARNAHMLFGTSAGLACVAAGLALDAIGALWMHRMSAAVAT